jgi:sn-glycerol 3-phosphate transport system substrate-binding protein
MFYYNKDMFTEVGLDPNNPPKTWDELRQYAQKLSVPNKRWGYEMPIDSWFYEAFIMQSNGNLLNKDETDIAFNNEAGIAPLKLWKTMIQEGSMKTPPGKEYNSFDATRSDFSAGITGMIVSSCGDLATLTKSCKFKIGTCFLPKKDRYGVPTGGANISMMTGHEKDADATMDFIKYLTSPDVAAYWATQTGYVPSSEAASKTDVYKKYLSANANANTALQQMQYTDIPRPVNINYAQIQAEIMMTEIQRCIEKADFTPEQAVKAISDKTKDLLKKK